MVSGLGQGKLNVRLRTIGKVKPCKNVEKGISESDSVYRANLTWKISDDHMIYGTWSEGYRPGGINRKPSAGEYTSDFLTNYELGWKTTWADAPAAVQRGRLHAGVGRLPSVLCWRKRDHSG